MNLDSILKIWGRAENVVHLVKSLRVFMVLFQKDKNAKNDMLHWNSAAWGGYVLQSTYF